MYRLITLGITYSSRNCTTKADFTPIEGSIETFIVQDCLGNLVFFGRLLHLAMRWSWDDSDVSFGIDYLVIVTSDLHHEFFFVTFVEVVFIGKILILFVLEIVS